SLELRLAPELPAVMADAVQIEQVLLNLIVNSVEAMQGEREDARILRITSLPTRRGAAVAVRGTGKGLDAGDPRRLFWPFFTTRTAGFGMGLTISRAIVESHGGLMWATANVDRGATFHFALPGIPPETEQPTPTSSQRRVLIVDDHEELGRSMERLLK